MEYHDLEVGLGLNFGTACTAYNVVILYHELLHTKAGLFRGDGVKRVALSGVAQTSSSGVALVAVRGTSCTTQHQQSQFLFTLAGSTKNR